jgi:hypothetical protein
MNLTGFRVYEFVRAFVDSRRPEKMHKSFPLWHELILSGIELFQHRMNLLGVTAGDAWEEVVFDMVAEIKI